MDTGTNCDDCLESNLQQVDIAENQMIFQNMNTGNLTNNPETEMLHSASQHGNIDETELSINGGFKNENTDSYGNTPLIIASKSNDIDTILELLEANACNVLTTNCHGESAAKIIIYDMRYMGIAILELLLNKVKEECSNDSLLTAKKLLELKCLLPQVVCLQDTFVTKYMLENGCKVDESDVNSGGLTALHQAVRSSDLENSKLLIQFGANINAEMLDSRTRPVHLVRCHMPQSTEILKILLEKGCSLVDDNDRFTIGKYFKYGNKEMVDLLMKLNLDLNIKDNLGTALVNYLAGNDKFDPVEILKGKTLNVNAPDDSYGATALMEAVIYQNIDTVNFLLTNNAYVNITDNSGMTPLVYAFYDLPYSSVLNVRLKCIELLLEYEADAQWASSDNRTIFDLVIPKDFILIKTILAEVALTDALGGIIKNIVQTKIASHTMFRSHFDFCKRKIKEMKRTTIYRSVTLFDFLTATEKKMSNFACNEIFIAKLKLIMYSKRRSKLYYDRVLRKRAKKIIPTAELRKKVFDVLCKIKEISSNQIVVMKIIDYFNYDDLLVISSV